MLSDDHGNDGVSAEKSFRKKQNERFFCRLMAKEASMANCSSRVFYYGETSVGIPFMWESQPGTPKHPLSNQTSLPPLTPPPSYYSSSNSNIKRRNSKLDIIFSNILSRFAGSRKAYVSPSSSRSSSSSSSWSLVYSSPSFSMRDKDQGDLYFSRSRSSTSTLDIPFKRKGSKGFRGCYPFGD